MLEITIVLSILIFSIILIRYNFFSACLLALVLSTFLHKELFSIYIWDLLPIRILMGAFLLSSAYDFFKWNKFSLRFVSYLKDPVILLSILFVSSKLVSTINSLDFKTSMFMNIFYVSVFNFILVLYLKLQEKQIFDLYKKYIFIAFLVALVPFIQIYIYFNNNYLFGAILNVAGLNVDFPSFSWNYDFFVTALKLVVMTRLGSIFWDVNHFGGFLAGLFVPALAVVLTSKGREFKYNLIYFIFISTALFLTNSRSAWIIGFVALFTFSFFVIYRKIGKRGVFYSLLGVLTVSVFLFSLYQDRDSLFREKVRSYLHYRMDSFDSHFLLLQGAVDVFNTYPIIGGGTGSFFEHFKETEVSNEFLKRDPAGLSGRVPAHSIWGEVMAESGAYGIFIFVGLVLIYLMINIYAINHANSWQDYFIYSSFLGSLLGWLVAGIFYSYNSEFFFILFFTPMIYLLKREKIVFEELFHYFKVKKLYSIGFLSAIILSLMLYNLGGTRLITFDESIYAKVSKNILETNDYLTLRWRNESDLWFEKPPLFFVVTAFFYQMLDVTEFSTRIGVVFFSLVCLIFTYKLSRIIFKSHYAGVFAVLGLTLNTSYLYYSRIGMLDVMLTSFIVGSIYYFLKFIEDNSKKYLIFTGILIGLGVLTKSMIGFLPMVIIGIYYLLNYFVLKNKNIRVFHLVIVFLVSILVSAPWHIYMYFLHGELFIKSYFGYHLFARFSTEIEDKGAPWDFYFVVLRNTMRIWYLILIPSLILFIYGIKKKIIPYTSWLLLISSFVIMVLFSSSSSKLKWYIMPIYPFLYIICGYFVYYIFNWLLLKRISYVVLGLLMYVFIFLNFSYMYSVRDMVYTSDFNSRQANMILINNSLPNIQKSYIDKLDYPVILFYNNRKDFDVMSYSQIRDTLPMISRDGLSASVITSVERFEQLRRIFPSLVVVQKDGDYVLATFNYLYQN